MSQVQGGIEKVIAYGGRTLNAKEDNYCITRKELLVSSISPRCTGSICSVANLPPELTILHCRGYNVLPTLLDKTPDGWNNLASMILSSSTVQGIRMVMPTQSRGILVSEDRNVPRVTRSLKTKQSSERRPRRVVKKEATRKTLGWTIENVRNAQR